MFFLHFYTKNQKHTITKNQRRRTTKRAAQKRPNALFKPFRQDSTIFVALFIRTSNVI